MARVRQYGSGWHWTGIGLALEKGQGMSNKRGAKQNLEVFAEVDRRRWPRREEEEEEEEDDRLRTASWTAGGRHNRRSSAELARPDCGAFRVSLVSIESCLRAPEQ
ncbi:hypothetical protein ACN47E_005505 [Coniothyrium glycines]